MKVKRNNKAATGKPAAIRDPECAYQLARAVGNDAGNRSMRAAGRTAWNGDDFNAAAREFNRVVDALHSAL